MAKPKRGRLAFANQKGRTGKTRGIGEPIGRVV